MGWQYFCWCRIRDLSLLLLDKDGSGDPVIRVRDLPVLLLEKDGLAVPFVQLQLFYNLSVVRWSILIESFISRIKKRYFCIEISIKELSSDGLAD